MTSFTPLDSFGLIVPGRMVISSFEQLSVDKFATKIYNPQTVTELTFFFAPNAIHTFPAGYGGKYTIKYQINQ